MSELNEERELTEAQAAALDAACARPPAKIEVRDLPSRKEKNVEAVLRPVDGMLDWALDQRQSLESYRLHVAAIPALFWHHKAGRCTTHILVMTYLGDDFVTVQLLRPHITTAHLGVVFQPPSYTWPARYAIHPDCSDAAAYMTGIFSQDVPPPDGTGFRPRTWYVGTYSSYWMSGAERGRGYSNTVAYRNREDFRDLEQETADAQSESRRLHNGWRDDAIVITRVEDTLVV